MVQHLFKKSYVFSEKRKMCVCVCVCHYTPNLQPLHVQWKGDFWLLCETGCSF